MSRNLRSKKNFHAVVKGLQPKSTGIYVDFSKLQEAISGMSTSIHSSFETLDAAVTYMLEHDVIAPRVIIFKDGMKQRFTLEEYKEGQTQSHTSLLSDTVITDLQNEMTRVSSSDVSSIHLLDEAVIDDLLSETIPVDSEGVDLNEALLEETIKYCEKSVMSFHEPITSTPFRSTSTGQTQDIGDLSSIPVSEEQSISSKVSAAVQVEIQVSEESGPKEKMSVDGQCAVESRDLSPEVKHMSTQSKPFEHMLKDSSEYSVLRKENINLRSELVRLKAENELLYKTTKTTSRHTQTECNRSQSRHTQTECNNSPAIHEEDVSNIPVADTHLQQGKYEESEGNAVNNDTYVIQREKSGVNFAGEGEGYLMEKYLRHNPQEQGEPENVNTRDEQTSPDNLSSAEEEGINTFVNEVNNFSDAASDQENEVTKSRIPTPRVPRNRSTLWFKCGKKVKLDPWLSNLYKAEVTVYGRTFNYQETAYQWKKSTIHNKYDEAERILQADSSDRPLDVMSIGQSVVTTKDWKTSIKFDVMREIREAAFSQNEEIRDKLLRTGIRPLREATHNWTWGGKGAGDNKMGELVEQIRSRFRDGTLKPFVLQSSPTEPMTSVLQSSPAESVTSVLQSSPTKPVIPARKSTKKGLMLGDSHTQSLHPRLGKEWTFITVPVSGGQVCPPSGVPSLEDKLSAVMSNEEVVGLMGGANDVKTASLSQFVNGYTSLVRKAKSNGARVICCGLYHRGDTRDFAERERLNMRIDTFNDAIRTIAADENVEFIDNCDAVQSTAQNPNLRILSIPRKGLKFLHLKYAEKIELAGRISRQILGNTNGWRIQKPSPTQNAYPRSGISEEASWSGNHIQQPNSRLGNKNHRITKGRQYRKHKNSYTAHSQDARFHQLDGYHGYYSQDVRNHLNEYEDYPGYYSQDVRNHLNDYNGYGPSLPQDKYSEDPRWSRYHRRD